MNYLMFVAAFYDYYVFFPAGSYIVTDTITVCLWQFS
jgi:uncharacterized membrane protein